MQSLLCFNTSMTTVKAKKETLERSDTNKVVAGVCGGLGTFLGIDPTIIRWAFVLFTVFGGSGLLVYLILWLLIPSPSGALIDKKDLQKGVEKMKEYTNQHNPNKLLGLGLLVLGVVFLLDNLGFHFYYFRNFWPLLIVGLGIYILYKND